MSDTWDSAPLAPTAPAAPAAGLWNSAPVVGATPQQKAVSSSNDNGEEAARALQIGKKTNLPPSVVQGDLPGYTAHQRQQSAVRAVQNPYIAKYVDDNPMAAKVSSDDWDAAEEASQALQALHPELVRGKAQVGVFGGIAEVNNLLASPPGRQKLLDALKQLPGAIGQGLLDFVQTPGKVASGEINLTTPQGLEQGIGFGLGVALGSRDIRVGRTGDVAAGISSSADVNAFLAKVRGAKTRQEINDFLASKQEGPPGAMLQIEHAKAGSEALDRAVEVAQNSKTKQRAPEMFEELAAAHDDGVVHIDAKKIVELYEKEGKVPAEGDGLFGFVPGLVEKVQAAAATGGEVTIPISKYIAHVDPTVHEGLKESVRLHDDGVTLEEAKEHEKAIEAWHGTPHDFERFDLTKIGTGEGAQVYGHGLYFAGNAKVGENYRDQLAPGPSVGKERFNSNNAVHLAAQAIHETGHIDLAQANLEKKLTRFNDKNDPFEAERKKISQAIKELDFIAEIGQPTYDPGTKGQLYKVSINADPTHFLDWDVPLAQQPESVQKFLTEKMQLRFPNSDVNKFETTGDIYKKLEGFATPKSLSKEAAEAGIPGIKYLDQGSRGAAERLARLKEKEQVELDLQKAYQEDNNQAGLKETADNLKAIRDEIAATPGTRNFVVFDDRLVKITEKNGEPVAAMLEAAVETEKLFMGLKTEPFMNMLFKDAKSVGITDSEFNKYSDKITRAEQAILDRAVATGKREAAKYLTPEWKRNEAAVRDEVTNELQNQSAFAAEKYLRENRIDIAHERAAQVADDLAPIFGFETGQDLLRGLESIEIEKAASGKGPQVQLRDAIKAETAARMEARYGNLAENIAKEAREIALADHTFDILADEVRILADAAGVSPPLSRTEMVEWAKRSFESSNIREATNWEKLRRAVERGGREAEKALLKGDFLEAFQAKQRQMLAATLAKESLGLQKVVDNAERKIDRFLSEEAIKGIDQGYLEQIRQMLASIGLPQQFAPLRDTSALRDFVAESEGQLAVAPWLMDGSQPKLQDMSVGQFREFVDSMKSLEHVGRQAQTLASAMEKAELQNVIFDIKKELDRFDLVKQPLNPTIVERAKAMGRWVTAAHLLVEKMLDYTDKFNPEGPLTKWLDRPLRDSNTKEIQLTERVSKQLRDLAQYTDSSINDIIPQKLIFDQLTNTWLNIDRGNLRQLAMYMGARENIAKVIDGFGVNEADVRRLLNDQMTEKDWKWVEGMWKIFADLHVDAAEMVLRDTGVPLAQKTAVPLTTKFGEVSGGYAPLIYDRARSNIQGDIAAKNPIFEPEFFTPATAHGYTEALTQYAGFLDLTGIQTAPKIMTMIHDIAFREAVRNASKLINNEEFMAAMTQKWSAEYAGLLPGWLRDIANVKNVDDQYAVGAARVMAGLRNNITSALIAFNPGTYMKHGGTAAAMSVRQVGAKELASAAKDLGIRSIWENARDLVQSTDARPTPEFIDALQEITDQGEKGEALREFILASSAVFRSRQRKPADSIRGAYEIASESGPLQTAKNVRHALMNVGRVPVALTDTMSAMPTWWAAYKKAIGEGTEHADAVFIADKEMSRAHGSNFIGDKPRVMRTGEAMRWVTPLYNFWNHNFNNHLQLAWDVAAAKRGPVEYKGPMIENGLPAPNVLDMFEKDGTWYYAQEQGANWKNISHALFWISVVPIIVHELAAPAKDEHGDKVGVQMLKAVAQHYGSMIIGLRDISNAALNGYDPSIGTLGTVSKILQNTGRDIKSTTAGKQARDGIAHTLTLLGALTGVGGQSPGKAIQFGVDVARGRERPRGQADWRQGLRTGHAKARKH